MLTKSAPPATTPSAAPPLPPRARTAADFFGAARDEGGWTGADGTYSVPLEDGRTAWLFGDTFIGGVQADGSRSQDPHTFVRTSVVVEDDGKFTTLTKHEDGANVDFVRPEGARENRDGFGPDPWYWPGHGTSRGSDLVLMMNRFVLPGGREAAPYSWQYDGTDVVTADASTGEIRDQRPLLPKSDTLWGGALLEQGPYTYMYGSKSVEGQPGRDVQVARAPRDEITQSDAWRFWNGTSWTSDAAAAASIGAQSSTQFGVVQAKDGSLLLASQLGFDHSVQGWRADRPQGPFEPVGELARIPDQPFGRHAYNAVPHPELAPGSDDLVLTYNVGGMDFLARHESYRPGVIVAPGALAPRA